MRVRFWGVRGSTPTPQKENMGYGGNTSCIEVRTDTNQILVFDGGTGIRLLGRELQHEDGEVEKILENARRLYANVIAAREGLEVTL